MKIFSYNTQFLFFLFLAFSYSCKAECIKGAYGNGKDIAVVLVEKEWIKPPDLGYLMLDGRFGSTLDKTKPFACERNMLYVKQENGTTTKLQRISFTRTKVNFLSANTKLTGELIEPKNLNNNSAPLLVMVHGSEVEPAIGSSRSMLFASMGIRVFVYDKRGTGQSEGLYTQNFELLADDATAAMQRAREIAKGRFQRSGYYGVSQGGWVAPLASTRISVDFIAIGFGLVSSPIEEDLDQMLQEAQQHKLDRNDIKQIRQLSEVTAKIVTSHFESGFEELDKLREEFSESAWVTLINGEYSGDMFRMPNQDLIRVGQAVFDNLELIWDYEASSALKKIKTPLLWALAENDREAPIDRTIKTLLKLKNQRVPIKGYVFPDTDHGMYKYINKKDGSRKNIRVSSCYFQLIINWVKDNDLSHTCNYLTLNEFNTNK